MFCDRCGEEIRRNCVSERYAPQLEVRDRDNGFVRCRLKAEVLITKDGVANAGHLCVSCVKTVVVEGCEPP
jgi:hypothetical protein